MAAGKPVSLVGKPPVPFRKVVDTHLHSGETVSVNAQQYVVLAYDVPPAPDKDRCGRPCLALLPGPLFSRTLGAWATLDLACKACILDGIPLGRLACAPAIWQRSGASTPYTLESGLLRGGAWR